MTTENGYAEKDFGEPDEYLTPEDYPTRCDCSAEQLQTLKTWFEDDDHGFGAKVGSNWPPRDINENPYPIYFTPDDINSLGKLRDSNGTPYSPFTGHITPKQRNNSCNAPLDKWRQRYPQVRYCGRSTHTENTYCRSHSTRIDPTELPTMTDSSKDPSAEELMQTGLHTKTIDHYYSNLSPVKKLTGWGLFESLMGDSEYEFGVEYETKSFDFSEADIQPEGVDESGHIDVKCGYPTQHTDRSLSLYVAAMMSIQMATVQPRIMYEDRENGHGMMEEQSVEAAQLTAPPSEHDPSPQQFKTLETWSEHHLNLPLSRLVTDRPKLLEYGGVGIDPQDNTDSVSEDDIVLEIQADSEDVETTEGGTDPNAFEDMKAQSEKIVEKASDETDAE